MQCFDHLAPAFEMSCGTLLLSVVAVLVEAMSVSDFINLMPLIACLGKMIMYVEVITMLTSVSYPVFASARDHL